MFQEEDISVVCFENEKKIRRVIFQICSSISGYTGFSLRFYFYLSSDKGLIRALFLFFTRTKGLFILKNKGISKNMTRNVK